MSDLFKLTSGHISDQMSAEIDTWSLLPETDDDGWGKMQRAWLEEQSQVGWRACWRAVCVREVSWGEVETDGGRTRERGWTGKETVGKDAK